MESRNPIRCNRRTRIAITWLWPLAALGCAADNGSQCASPAATFASVRPAALPTYSVAGGVHVPQDIYQPPPSIAPPAYILPPQYPSSRQFNSDLQSPEAVEFPEETSELMVTQYRPPVAQTYEQRWSAELPRSELATWWRALGDEQLAKIVDRAPRQSQLYPVVSAWISAKSAAQQASLVGVQLEWLQQTRLIAADRFDNGEIGRSDLLQCDAKEDALKASRTALGGLESTAMMFVARSCQVAVGEVLEPPGAAWGRPLAIAIGAPTQLPEQVVVAVETYGQKLTLSQWQAWSEIEKAMAAISTIDQQLQQLATPLVTSAEVIQLKLDQYAAGRASLLETLEAQSDYFDLLAKQNQLKADLVLAHGWIYSLASQGKGPAQGLDRAPGTIAPGETSFPVLLPPDEPSFPPQHQPSAASLGLPKPARYSK